MNTEEIKELFMQGIDCSQVIAGYFSEAAGIEKETLRKISACFGGGMQCAETCGAVTGALMIIGLKYGHAKEGDREGKQRMLDKTAEFKEEFHKEYPSCICRELLEGYDISNPDDMEIILEKGLLFQFCPNIVKNTIQILENIL